FATSGVTAVSTRAGSDHLQMSANSFFPRLLFTNGGIHGVEYWEPNAGASGPILKGRLYAEQAISYRFDRNRYDTLNGPQISQYPALMSWSQLDLRISDGQRATMMMSFDPQTSQHAGITAFTPAGTVPRVEQGGWRTGIADRFTLSPGALLEFRLSVVR